MLEKKKVLLQTWVPLDVAERIRARAQAAERSVAAEVRCTLRASLDATGGGGGRR